MIIIENGQPNVPFLERKSYYRGKNLFTQCCMQITKRIRAGHVLRLMEARQFHLDIGCGDGYFLKKSPCRVRYGMDERYGDYLTDSVESPDEFFEYVTMLAVIEHLRNPKVVLAEICRILKPNGRLIITTPKRCAEKIIKLYARNVEKAHVSYVDEVVLSLMMENRFRIVHRETFLFGLNQLFCLEKIGTTGS